MSGLKFSELYNFVYSFVGDANRELIIICPFIKASALEKILSHVEPNIKLKLIVRWDLADLVLGASDLEVYKQIKDLGGNLYLNKRIHLKVILKDEKELLLGSANITNKGLGLTENSNIEVMQTDKINQENLEEIKNILSGSVNVDDRLFDKISKLKQSFESVNAGLKEAFKGISEYDKFLIGKEVKNVRVLDFPFSKTAKDFFENYSKGIVDSEDMAHDMKLFKLNNQTPFSEIRKVVALNFLSGKAFAWQESILEKEILFGKYSELLHNALLDDPKPYRKTVKVLVGNMFEWSSVLSDNIKIKEYSHTRSLVRVE